MGCGKKKGKPSVASRVYMAGKKEAYVSHAPEGRWERGEGIKKHLIRRRKVSRGWFFTSTYSGIRSVVGRLGGNHIRGGERGGGLRRYS